MIPIRIARDLLLQEARQALSAAYAPYSKYQVGAALLGANGTVYHGCNVENASYGLTLCAERVALFSAIAAGCTRFKAIAIVASGAPPPVPCGACRQVLSEHCTRRFPIFFASASDLKGVTRVTLAKLLPYAFHLKPPAALH